MKISSLLTVLALSAFVAPAAMAKGTAGGRPAHVKVHVAAKSARMKSVKPAKKSGKVRKQSAKRKIKPAVEA